MFRNDRDEWSDPVNLGPLVNTPGTFEYSPYVSPDREFFFFMTARPAWDRLAPGGSWDGASLRFLAGDSGNGASDIYWMEAAFLESLRPPGF